MLRGFRHTLFVLLQVGAIVSGLLALAIEPESWRAICICLAGVLLASMICDRMAARYLRHSLGRLRRLADDIGRGRATEGLEVPHGADFHKLASAIQLVATRLAESKEEEQRLQDELRRRERLAFLGELAATVAHEVNNPLDGIQNCSRILRRHLGDPGRAECMLDLIDSGLVRIDTIVRRLLTLARQNVIRPVDAQLSAVVDAAVAAVGSKLDSAGVQVVRLYEARDDQVRADPQLLEQVFVNLILNAIDSMPGGGELTLRIVRRPARGDEPETLAAQVADRGVGIAPETLPHVFEPFFTTKAGGKGTGLGLPIAARIVDAHGGMLSVEPRAGGGVVFTVRLIARVGGAHVPGPVDDLVSAGGGPERGRDG
jgi:signal transduction histidine kinase